MDFTEAQTALVKAIVGSAAIGAWERLVANVEILEHEGDYQLDYVCLAVVRGDGTLSTEQFDLSDEAREAAAALYRQRKEEAGETIGGFEATVDSTGAYRIAIDHDAPKRINGVWDEEREGRLDHYLDHYKAELAGSR